MKVLLLNPPSLPGTTTDRRTRCTVKSPQNLVHPPIGLATIASAIQAWNKAELTIVDAVIANLDVSAVNARIKDFKPGLIIAAIGSYTFRWDLTALKNIQAVQPVSIAVFGEMPTALAETILAENAHVDFCIRGESELASSHLVEYLQGTRDLGQVANVAYRLNGEIKKNQIRMIDDLDTVPYPDRKLLANEKYHCIPFLTEPYTDLITSRGCPYRCKFCTTIPYWGNKFRKRSPENILGEVRECVERFGIRSFFIPDETYTVDRLWVARLNQGFQELNVRWGLQTRVDLVDEDLLRQMAQSGCVYVHYGVESGSQKILDYYRKGITVEQIRKAFAWTKQAGIEVNASFIIGCPEETPETVAETIKLAKEIQADYVHFSPLIPLPLSEFYEEFKIQGLLLHERFEEYVKPNIVFKPKYMTAEEIRAAIQKAYRATIMNPVYVLRYVLKVLKKGDPAEFKRLFIAAKWVRNSFFKKACK